MPYFIFVVTKSETTTSKSVKRIAEYENFKLAKTEVRRLRKDEPLEEKQTYRIMFADEEAEAEQRLREAREETIAREWEK